MLNEINKDYLAREVESILDYNLKDENKNFFKDFTKISLDLFGFITGKELATKIVTIYKLFAYESELSAASILKR